MGGLAGAVGEGRLSAAPRWLIGGNAALVVAVDAPTLWLVDVDDPVTLARAEAVALRPGEAAFYAGRADAGERLVRRRLARLMLAAATGRPVDRVAIERTALGAPVVAHPPGWHLSVAARWPACLIGIAPAPLGVDVERVEPALPPAADLLAPGERAQLALAADAPRFFARAWAAKEAHAKYWGDPRRADPALIETAEARVRSPAGETRCWRHDTGDLTAAVATDGRTG